MISRVICWRDERAERRNTCAIKPPPPPLSLCFVIFSDFFFLFKNVLVVIDMKSSAMNLTNKVAYCASLMLLYANVFVRKLRI